jgi:hypothetical protein
MNLGGVGVNVSRVRTLDNGAFDQAQATKVRLAGLHLSPVEKQPPASASPTTLIRGNLLYVSAQQA